MTDTTPLDAATCGAPSHDGAHDPSPPCSRIDWQRYVAGGGEIQRTTVDTCDACDACDATATVHVIGQYGGVLAFCADSNACVRRQCEASDAPSVTRAGGGGERAE